MVHADFKTTKLEVVSSVQSARDDIGTSITKEFDTRLPKLERSIITSKDGLETSLQQALVQSSSLTITRMDAHAEAHSKQLMSLNDQVLDLLHSYHQSNQQALDPAAWSFPSKKGRRNQFVHSHRLSQYDECKC